ncbi:peptidyl-tRNA hydrolase [Cytobacillus spongiae]|jgi:peptidyl-tRNA hydrolase|uniref:aminoacyl-tRNA hydrolase n=1 Tax=Cytobacillus spongiae TaxID=2901381 RepID=UPI001F200F33|nr:aminoacyl-tRNA hydrolase [Cytobacillus spongiae]UII54346.1 peptidyl-tRNA hydrolase [Cytobacillus spongiae]
MLVQYFIVNSDLKMSTGKVAAQVAHAATVSALTYMKELTFKEWLEMGQTKIVLKAKEANLIKLKEAGFIYILDAGKTEIPSGSLTVVALPPMEKEEAKKLVGHLSLLK